MSAGTEVMLVAVLALIVNPILMSRTNEWPRLPRLLLQVLVNVLIVWLILGRIVR